VMCFPPVFGSENLARGFKRVPLWVCYITHDDRLLSLAVFQISSLFVFGSKKFKVTPQGGSKVSPQ